MILLGLDATPIMTDTSTVQSVQGVMTWAPSASPLDATNKQQVTVTGVDWPTFFTNCTTQYNIYNPL